MTKVLFVGLEPDTVDYSDPALPPGLDAEKIHAGIAIAMRQMSERGWHAVLCLVRPDTAGAMLASKLAADSYDCVVIGGGVRIPPKNLMLLEALINVAHKAAPGASIAFNTRPEDTADAVMRVLKGT